MTAAALEQRLGHRFADAALLEQALTHRSFGTPNNERLEFLGDGVLDCAVAHELFLRFPDIPEGKLTQIRSGLIRKEALAEIGAALEVGAHLRLGTAVPLTESLLADAVEALVGAVFLDRGYDAARACVARIMAGLLAGVDPRAVLKDAKTRLQEVLQARKRPLPEYRLLGEQLSAGANHFEVECVLPDEGLRSRGSGASRQKAEQQAATAMLERLS